MFRSVLLALLLVSNGAFALAETSFQELSRIMDLEASLKAVSTDPTLLTELKSNQRLVLFTGTIASRKVINGEEDNFIGELELIDGEWHGTSAVSMYKSYLRLEGPQYYGTIPERRSRQKNPREIETNTRYLVIGEVVDLRRDEKGDFPVVKVLFLRRM
ncbi:hypothetical protein [Marispirochaeta sp.]|uniref:hypothetical protein n=1 Tax=Marispirochaeta sp. TaxID=2038653 RepID=UPI0029C8ADAA|nr:hypothetical protein [Marispirochaeta sp.]